MKNTDTKEKILELIFDFPDKEFHLREISRLVNISAPSVSKALNELKKRELVDIDKGVLLKIKANQKNEEFKHIKRISNLAKIYNSGLYKYIKEEFPLDTLILFGSYSKGEDTQNSDIDIAILNSKEKKLELKKYESVLNKKINIEFINIKNISRELKNSIINGITLSGHIEI